MMKAAHVLLSLVLAAVPLWAHTDAHLYSPETNLERSELASLRPRHAPSMSLCKRAPRSRSRTRNDHLDQWPRLAVKRGRFEELRHLSGPNWVKSRQSTVESHRNQLPPASWCSPRDAISGETWILAVEFTTPLKAEGLTSYGNSTQPGTNIAPTTWLCWGERKLRTLWMTRADILRDLEEKTTFLPLGERKRGKRESSRPPLNCISTDTTVPSITVPVARSGSSNRRDRGSCRSAG